MIYKTWRELSAALRPLDLKYWTYYCLGENLGTRDAVITGYVIRQTTAAEQRKWDEDFIGLTNAQLDSVTPANGGRS